MYVKDDNKVTLFSGRLRKIQKNQLKYAMNQRRAKFKDYINAFLKKLNTVFNAVSCQLWETILQSI